ncbi:MAG: hypothetical protein IJX63_10110 [Lachnospiraceae bacterium]|nr:hypothetical protein [Lachnospiraceae bacterium]
MEDLLYWIIEYVKVLLGYGFIMYIWPSAVFRKYLRGKSVTFRFGFCTTVQVVLVSTVVLMLGLVHILNRWTMWIFFYGLFIWSFREKFKVTENTKKKFKYLITGTFGWKHLLLLAWEGIIRFVKKTFRVFWKFYKVHWLEYTLLVVTVVYGMIYFSWGAFQECSYGFSDIYVHHEWIYNLVQGKPFSAGIYPEGMHCIIYSLYALFGIKTYSGLLFIGCVNIIATILALYCLMKEIFCWRYSSIFALIMILTLNMLCMNQVTAMARMQCALPQEFGFPALYMCALYLIRFLKTRNYAIREKVVSRKPLDENLLLFCMALAATIVIHFYATIMAFFLCLGIAIIYLKRIFSKEHFFPLVAAAILGVLIAAFPMVTGVVMGLPLQGSLYWGMSVIKGTANTTNVQVQESTQQPVTDVIEDNVNYEHKENGSVIETQGVTSQQTEQIQQISQPSLLERWSNLIKEKGETLYKSGYKVLYQDLRAKWILSLNALIFLIWILYRVVSAICYYILKFDKINRFCFDGYPMMILSSILFVITYAAPELGLPSLIESSRTCFIGYSLGVMTVVMAIDMIFAIMMQCGIKVFLHVLSVGVSIAIVAVIYMTNNYHGYLYFELTRFTASVNITNEIMESLERNTYTIISPTEELYQTIEEGRHEEILTLMENQEKSVYTIPTEYVFVFIEKKPLKYVQVHYFNGPEWLAQNRIEGTKYITSVISEEEAQKAIKYGSKLSDSYMNLSARTILESKMYQWCKRFNELYPNELKTYYEDEYFVCYYMKQNTQCLYNMSLK